MTRGIWGRPRALHRDLLVDVRGVWRHGDWALIDEDGDWYLLGRSDDTINVAGKRLGPAEVESVLVSHPAVAESAVVGVPHETKGEAIWCFCVLGPTAPARRWPRSSASWSPGARAPVQAVAGRVRRGAAEDPLGEDPAPRGARGGRRGGPRRHVLGREPSGARRHPRGARFLRSADAPSIRRTSSSTSRSRRLDRPGSMFSAVSEGRWKFGMRPFSSAHRCDRRIAAHRRNHAVPCRAATRGAPCPAARRRRRGAGRAGRATRSPPRSRGADRRSRRCRR